MAVTGTLNGVAHELSREEAAELFSGASMRLVNMPGEEFIRCYDAGKFDQLLDDPAHPEFMHVAMLLPLVR